MSVLTSTLPAITGEATQDLEMQLTEAYDSYADAIFRHCYFRLSNRERAKEIMQDTFMRTWNFLQDGKQVDNMRAFLYRIANNLIVDEYRKKKEASLDQLQEEGWDPAGPDGVEHWQNSIEEGRVFDVLKNMDDDFRTLFHLRYVDGLSPKEIGELVGESANTLSVRLHRGVKKLRGMLEPAA